MRGTSSPRPSPRPRAVTPARVRALAHALSDETRLKILARLSAGEHCVCNLTDVLEAGQSRLSFHLKALKDSGLITDRREGRWVYYALNAGAIQELETYLATLRDRAVLVEGVRCCL